MPNKTQSNTQKPASLRTKEGKVREACWFECLVFYFLMANSTLSNGYLVPRKTYQIIFYIPPYPPLWHHSLEISFCSLRNSKVFRMEMHFLTPLHTTTLKLPDLYVWHLLCVITWELCNGIWRCANLESFNDTMCSCVTPHFRYSPNTARCHS